MGVPARAAPGTTSQMQAWVAPYYGLGTGWPRFLTSQQPRLAGRPLAVAGLGLYRLLSLLCTGSQSPGNQPSSFIGERVSIMPGSPLFPMYGNGALGL